MVGVVGFLITFLLQIYQPEKEFRNRLRFDRDITMSMVTPLFMQHGADNTVNSLTATDRAES